MRNWDNGVTTTLLLLPVKQNFQQTPPLHDTPYWSVKFSGGLFILASQLGYWIPSKSRNLEIDVEGWQQCLPALSPSQQLISNEEQYQVTNSLREDQIVVLTFVHAVITSTTANRGNGVEVVQHKLKLCKVWQWLNIMSEQVPRQ